MDNPRIAVWPKRGSGLGAASWARELGSLALRTVHAPPSAGGAPHGDGHGVLVIPGFLAGDWTSARLRHFIRSLGYRTQKAGIVFNRGPTAALMEGLDDLLDDLHAETGAPVSLVGQSLGGVFARDMAFRHPDKVRRVVTLCSPIRYPVQTPLAPVARVLGLSFDARFTDRRKTISGNPPAPVTAVYSRDDGIVDWRACLQDETPDHDNVCVAGRHSTIGSNPLAQAIVADRLARP